MYLDLMIELQSLWNTKIKIVPLVFGALGSLHKKTVLNFELLQLTEISINQLQRTVLLKTDRMSKRYIFRCKIRVELE